MRRWASSSPSERMRSAAVVPLDLFRIPLCQGAGDAAEHFPPPLLILHLADLVPQGQGQVGEVRAGGHHALLGEPITVFRPPAPPTDHFSR